MKEMQYSEHALQQVRERRLLINRCDEWLFEDVIPFLGKRVLEVGCGMGNLIHLLVDRDFVMGTDISEDSVRYVQREYAAYPNVQARVGDITDPAILALADNRFDTVISLNVFEHINDDGLALQHAFHLLQPDGRMVLVVPAMQWLYGSMDRSIGHYRRYTKASAASRMKEAGFEVETQKYMNLLGMVGWFVNGRVLRQQVPPVQQLKLFNVLVPFAKRIERACQLPIGLSLLTVARRPE